VGEALRRAACVLLGCADEMGLNPGVVAGWLVGWSVGRVGGERLGLSLIISISRRLHQALCSKHGSHVEYV
jgi:hypothetical protein